MPHATRAPGRRFVPVSIRLILTVFMALASITFVAPPAAAQQPIDPTAANSAPRYFTETGHAIAGDFRRYYESQGGLSTFGLPITREFLWSGRMTQFFERAVFQSFPELADQGFGVQLVLLGTKVTEGKTGGPWDRLAAAPAGSSGQFFPETGHTLDGRFLRFWQQNNGIQNFGYPISQPFDEQSPPPPAGDGQSHLVQYFERARLEYQPQFSGTRSEVSLGLLGTAYAQAQNLPQPVMEREPAPNATEAREPITPETPNGVTLRPNADADGVKRVTLTAEAVEQELLNYEGKRVVAKTFGYNGGSPGPTLVFTVGDRVAITVVNNLPEATSVHWHGVIVPNVMDGVPEAGEPSPLIKPGERFTYEFTVLQTGTHMYHSHTDTPKQDLLGLAGGLIFLPKQETGPKIAHDYVYFLNEWTLPQEMKPEDIKDMPRTGSPVDTVNSVTAMPDWTSMDFNFLTMNGKSFPSTAPLDVERGERIRVRFFNIGMNTHPMHLHGQDFLHVEQDGNRFKDPMQLNTITVAPGQTQAIEFDAMNPGIWPFHCHLAHHVGNNMSSGFGGMATVVRIQ